MRGRGAAVAAMAVICLVSGCGGSEEPEAGPGESTSTTNGSLSPGPSTSPSSGGTALPGTAPPLEIRAVRASSADASGADAEELEQLDCATDPDPGSTDEQLSSCDPDGVKYVLSPAAIVGGVQSATASIPRGGVGWVIQVELDDDASRTFARLTTSASASQEQLAIVLDGRVLVAPIIQTPITGGALEIAGDFSEAEAEALAAAIAR